MKRFLAILLSALMVFSTISVMAAEVEETTLTNVAFCRPVFTSWTSGANEPDRMVDDDPTSGWVSNKFTASGATVIDGSYIWALVDLGSEYTIDEIKITVADNANYVSRDRQNYSVYVTNTRPETNLPVNCPVDTMGMTEVYTAPSLADTTEGAPVENVIDVAAVEATQGNKYRYVFLQKSNIIDEAAKAAGGTGMGHWFWAINDLQVLTSDDVAEDAPKWIEVAKNRPAFSGEVHESDAYAARCAIDGDVSTAFIASDWGNGIKARFVVDLEKEYPIEAVVFTPRYSPAELYGFEIYATNDNTFEHMAPIHKQPLNAQVDYGHLYYEAPEALSGKKYRYIVVQSDDANNNLGINDLKVYTSDITADRPFMINRSYVTNVNNPVVTDCGQNSTYPFANLTDNDSATVCLVSSGNDSAYIGVDLVVPQSIDYVTYALKGFPNYDYGMEIVASNNADLTDGVVMYSAVDDEGNYFCPTGTTGDTKGFLLFPATEEMMGNKYRYVGMRYPKNLTTSTQIVRGGATMFNVYTKGSNMSAAMSNAEITKAGYAFTLTIKDLLTINDKLSFIGAVYDTDGTLLEVKTADVKPAKKLNRSTTEVSATIDFADSDYADSNATVKLMLWDSLSNTVRPVFEEEFANLQKEIVYESVTQYATSHKSNSTATAANYEIDAINRLVDGDYSTLYGAGPAANGYFTFIDLGEGGRRVDKVAITVDDPHNRTVGQKYYLANTLPINGADRSGWVYLGERAQDGTTMTFVLTAEQAGTYRYVVADCTGETVGDYVNEIEVYKDADIVEPVVAQNVSRGKSVTASHAGMSGYANTAVITDSVFKAANGNNQHIITKAPSTVCIDLEDTYSIEKLVLDAALKDATYNFTVNLDVYISDYPAIENAVNPTSTKVLAGSAEGWDSSVKTLELEKPVVGRYVIIQKTALGASNDSFRLSEVQAFGIPVEGVSYEYEQVQSSADVTSYYAQLQNAGWAVNTNNNVSTTVFTDNDSQTIYGRGHGGDVAWIDLGEAKRIDAVSVQINDGNIAIPSNPMVFYVTNDDPAEALRANTDENGCLTVPENWLSVNGNGHIWTTKMISETTYGLAEAGNYRYVIVTYPGANYKNANGLEAYVSEITPYVLVTK